MSPVFSARAVLWVTLAAVVSALAFLVLTAFAPELRTESDGGAHALSTSAVGFAGVVQLLRDEGAPVRLSRSLHPDREARGALLVLTPAPGSNAKTFAALHTDGSRLIILPKWITGPDPERRSWVSKLGAYSKLNPAIASGGAMGQAASTQVDEGSSRPVLSGGGALFDARTHIPLGSIENFQTFRQLPAGWSPALIDAKGRIVLAADQTQTFVLSDPDLLNTQGLAQRANAAAAGSILNALRGYEAPVVFDVTLNGFARSRDILKLMFEPPFLSATLCALVTALLMGLHAAVRFGAAAAPARALAFGKRALADNSAALIRLAGREPAMARRYAAMTRDLVAAELALPRDLDEPQLAATLERIGRTRKVGDSFADLDHLARGAADHSALMRAARTLYRWRLEMTHGPL